MHEKYWFFASLLLISISAVLAVYSAWDDTLVMDEVPHIAAGYSYLTKQDMRLNPEHPPLVKDLAAIPLLFLNLKQDAFSTGSWRKEVDDEFGFGRTFIYGSGNDADKITRLARMPMLLVFALSGIFIAKWGRKLYGPNASLLALTLFCFSPLVLAHSRFVTTDVPATLGVLLATCTFLKYLRKPSFKTLLVSSITLGFALLVKFSLLLLLPYFFFLAMAFRMFVNQSFLSSILKGAANCLLLFLLAFSCVVGPVYFFQIHHYPPRRQHHDTEKQLEGIQKRRFLPDMLIEASRRPISRALAQYGLGAALVARQVRKGVETYFLGKAVRGAFSYFPVVYFMKEPLPWWVLLFITLALSLQTISKRRDLGGWAEKNFDQFAMLLWIVLYWILSLSSSLNIGARHLLPVYPFTILLVSGQITLSVSKLKESESRLYKPVLGLVILLIGWYLFESVRFFPSYLAYFNSAVGGPRRGFRYVVDSNLDWGQDLKRLASWTEKNKIAKMELDYFGSADPAYYLKERYIPIRGGQYTSLNSFLAANPKGGYIGVSATYYTHSHLYPAYSYAWLDRYKPLTVVGYSIFVWKILPHTGQNE